MTTESRDAAWSALHDATPKGLFVGQPSYHDERLEWTQYAFDPSERAEVGVLLEMARCLRELGEIRSPH